MGLSIDLHGKESRKELVNRKNMSVELPELKCKEKKRMKKIEKNLRTVEEIIKVVAYT